MTTRSVGSSFSIVSRCHSRHWRCYCSVCEVSFDLHFEELLFHEFTCHPSFLLLTEMNIFSLTSWQLSFHLRASSTFRPAIFRTVQSELCTWKDGIPFPRFIYNPPSSVFDLRLLFAPSRRSSDLSLALEFASHFTLTSLTYIAAFNSL